MKQRVFSTPRILRHTPLILLTAILTSCATGRIDPTDPVGENAKQIDGIMRLSGYMATAVGIFVAIAVVVVIVKLMRFALIETAEIKLSILLPHDKYMSRY